MILIEWLKATVQWLSRKTSSLSLPLTFTFLVLFLMVFYWVWLSHIPVQSNLWIYIIYNPLIRLHNGKALSSIKFKKDSLFSFNCRSSLFISSFLFDFLEIFSQLFNISHKSFFQVPILINHRSMSLVI